MNFNLSNSQSLVLTNGTVLDILGIDNISEILSSICPNIIITDKVYEKLTLQNNRYGKDRKIKLDELIKKGIIKIVKLADHLLDKYIEYAKQFTSDDASSIVCALSKDHTLVTSEKIILKKIKNENIIILSSFSLIEMWFQKTKPSLESFIKTIVSMKENAKAIINRNFFIYPSIYDVLVWSKITKSDNIIGDNYSQKIIDNWYILSNENLSLNEIYLICEYFFENCHEIEKILELILNKSLNHLPEKNIHIILCYINDCDIKINFSFYTILLDWLSHKNDLIFISIYKILKRNFPEYEKENRNNIIKNLNVKRKKAVEIISQRHINLIEGNIV